MHKVAIVKSYGYDGYSLSGLAQNISEWEEISDEDFKLLKQAQATSYGDKAFTIIEFKENQKEFIATTVAGRLKQIKAEQAKQAAAQAKRDAEELKRKEAARIKKESADKKKLEKMLKDLGMVAVPQAPSFDDLPPAQ